MKVNPQIDEETKKEEESLKVESETEEQMQIAGVKVNPQISDAGKINVNSQIRDLEKNEADSKGNDNTQKEKVDLQIRDAEENATVNPWIRDTEKKVTVTPQISDWDEDSDTVSEETEPEKQVEEITADEVSKFLM